MQLTGSTDIVFIHAQEILLDCGRNILNLFDNEENGKDEVILSVEMFVSNDGSSLSSQVCVCVPKHIIVRKRTFSHSK